MMNRFGATRWDLAKKLLGQLLWMRNGLNRDRDSRWSTSDASFAEICGHGD